MDEVHPLASQPGCDRVNLLDAMLEGLQLKNDAALHPPSKSRHDISNIWHRRDPAGRLHTAPNLEGVVSMFG
jgi:hypothetical protein